MARLTAVAATLAVAAAQNGKYQQCFDEWRCISHATVGNQLYSWDFRPLCRRPGQEYTAQDPSGNWWAFNICGMVSYSCIPDGYADPFAHGIAHQYLEGTPQSATTQGGTGCKNPTTDPATGAQTCTSQCIMAAVEEPDYELINPGDVNGGVEIFHAGVAPDADSPFKCPFDPKVGCSGARSMTYYFTCDKNQRNGLGNVYINETSSCQYFIQATTSYACATKGDPFDPYRDNPADSFGFVVLGAFLTVLFQYIYAFGDQRSWWEPIKQRIPAIPGLSGFGGKGGVYGGSSYRAVSQPIGGASPYGSTSM